MTIHMYSMCLTIYKSNETKKNVVKDAYRHITQMEKLTNAYRPSIENTIMENN